MNAFTGRLARFIRDEVPTHRTLTIKITADKDFFAAYADFKDYFQKVEPQEEVAFLKGYLARQKEEKNNQGEPNNGSRSGVLEQDDMAARPERVRDSESSSSSSPA